MSIPLPEPAWFITLTPECSYDDSPLGKDYNKYNLGLNEEEIPDLYIRRTFPETRLKGDRRVVGYKPVWYICPFCFTRPAELIGGEDAYQGFRKHLGGTWVRNCIGEARVYPRRPQALADLAKCDVGTGHIYSLARGKGGDEKKLAAAVLDGDLGSLPVLADRLEEIGHPLAEVVRDLCSPPMKKRARKKR